MSPQGSWSGNRSVEAARRHLSKEDQKHGERIESPKPKQCSFASPKGADPEVPNKVLLAAVARNETRLKQANLEDKRAPGEPKKHCCFV